MDPHQPPVPNMMPVTWPDQMPVTTTRRLFWTHQLSPHGARTDGATSGQQLRRRRAGTRTLPCASCCLTSRRLCPNLLSCCKMRTMRCQSKFEQPMHIVLSLPRTVNAQPSTGGFCLQRRLASPDQQSRRSTRQRSLSGRHCTAPARGCVQAVGWRARRTPFRLSRRPRRPPGGGGLRPRPNAAGNPSCWCPTHRIGQPPQRTIFGLAAREPPAVCAQFGGLRWVRTIHV